jgi:hypothetical protein
VDSSAAVLNADEPASISIDHKRSTLASGYVESFCTGAFACFYIGNISLPTRGSIGLSQSDRACLLQVLSTMQSPILVIRAYSLLVLLVVVDLGVPEEGLHQVSASGLKCRFALLACITHLVTVSPEVVLGPDVLEGVLGLVLERGAVRDVLPVLGPEPVGVDAGEDDAGDHNAVWRLVFAVYA